MCLSSVNDFHLKKKKNKKTPKLRDFYTQDSLVHFLYESSGFSLVGFVGTLPTLDGKHVVFTFDR